MNHNVYHDSLITSLFLSVYTFNVYAAKNDKPTDVQRRPGKHVNCVSTLNAPLHLPMSSRRGWGRRSIGQGFDRSLWPRDRAFELSCCPGGRDI